MILEKKYKKLSDIEHVLHRPGMYVGSVEFHKDTQFLFNTDRFLSEEIDYNPGFLKLFDEIISNSVDEHKRNPSLNKIEITVDLETGFISVWDNGGIPVKKHSEYNEWIPEMIFSNLKSGSNFDDSEDRIVVGTNGVGSTLTNIFSKEFKIETCDGENEFIQTFYNNMSKRSNALINKGKRRGYTRISWITDFQRFGMNGIDEYHFKLIEKRCYDIAGCNNKLKVVLNGEEISFKSFSDYCSLYTDDLIYEGDENWKICIGYSKEGFKHLSFVNTVETKDGGTHVNYITNQITSWLKQKLEKKHKCEIKPSDIRQHLFIFINTNIVNPVFHSQTKEKLTTEVKDFGSRFSISEKTLKKILKTEIVNSVLDWVNTKKKAEERANLRRVNKDIDKKNVIKLIDAKERKNREICTLGIFEGDSAVSAFRKYREANTQGAFPLRGKFINVKEKKDSQIIQNQEVKSIMSSLGLKIGEPPESLRYGKILLYTDADHDGNAISGLLINFFAKYWPELFEEQRIWKVETPIVVAKKKGKIKNFYTNDEFNNWISNENQKGWDIEYKKGLAALEDDEYREIIKNPKMFCLTKDEEFFSTLNLWFSKESEPRKEKILNLS